MNIIRSILSRISRVVLLSIGFVILFSSAAHSLPEINPSRYVAPSPSQVPDYKGGPISLPAAEGNLAEPSPAEQTDGNIYTLAELVDIALQINPVTRYAWAQAQASAANWGISHAPYYPSVSAAVVANGGDIPQLQGGESFVSANATLNYLLLDFGGRGAKAEAAKQALMAANWNHNQAIQDVLRNVPQAYYTHLAAKALVAADEKSLIEAETTVRSTEERLKSGVSTLSDVLQARSNADQVRLRLASDRGQVAITKGNLATAIGWPANRRFEIAREPDRLPVKEFSRSVDGLVDLARENRPALGAAVHAVDQAAAQLKAARALPFPQLNGTASSQILTTKDQNGTFNYGGVTLSVPIFDGFNMKNSVRAARAQLDAARASLKTQEESVVTDVWDAYSNYRTALEQFTASKSLLTSASESFDASSARYKEGAADIVELLNAQSVLASARAQLIGARMNISTSYAELLHAVGAELPAADDRIKGETDAAQ